MKRALFIVFVFVFLICVTFMTSCACDVCSTLTVKEIDSECNAGPCSRYIIGEKELEGIHVENSCIDCFWAPFAFGCYSNEMTEAATKPHNRFDKYYTDSCPSCVACGFDFTFFECYGDDHTKFHGSDHDTRKVVQAVNGEHYVIDKFTVVVNDHIEEYEGGLVSDFAQLIALINLKEAVNIKFYVEFTALTELHSAEFSTTLIYKENSLEDSFDEGFKTRLGNESTSSLKSKCIQPGKHIMQGVISLNMYEAMRLEDIPGYVLDVYTYEVEK